MLTTNPQKRVSDEKLELLYKKFYPGALLSAFLAVALAYAFREYLPIWALLFWLLLQVLIVIVRYREIHAYGRIRDSGVLSQRHWFLRHALEALFYGTVWGGFTMYLTTVPPDTAPDTMVHLALLLLCAASLCAFVAFKYSYSFFSFLVFSTPLLAPTGILLITGTDMGSHHLLGYLVFAFLIAMIFLSWRINDVTERNLYLKIENRELEIISTKDALTGISNRRHFDQVFANEWSRAMRQSNPLSLIICDIDHFKDYNDTLGHLRGDEYLRKFAQMLDEYARRAGDLVARFGGEEFILLLPDTTQENAEKFAEKLRRIAGDMANREVENLESAHPPTASFGIAATIPDRDNNPENLVKRADEALYKAKEEGRNQTVVAS